MPPRPPNWVIKVIDFKSDVILDPFKQFGGSHEGATFGRLPNGRVHNYDKFSIETPWTNGRISAEL